MSLPRKIVITWFSIVSLSCTALVFLPHREVEVAWFINNLLFLLLAVVSWHIFRREPIKKNKPIFFNFAISFGAAVLYIGYYFVGRSFFTGYPYATFFFYEYVCTGLYSYLLTFPIVYIVVDALFNQAAIHRKYTLTVLIVTGVFVYYYYPVLQDPKYLYSTPDVADYKAISMSVESLAKAGITNPSTEEVASSIQLFAWEGGKRVGTLFDENKRNRIEELMPYLEGSNYLLLVYKPVHLNVTRMNVLSVVFIFLFFGYQYKKDPPQGAYIEKILFLFLPYCSLEILHYFAYVSAVEYPGYLEIFQVAQYFTIVNTVLLIVFFSLRLRFITSAQGEFYEQELVSDSQHISRWRDGIDNLVVRHFLNPKTLHGRLLAPRTPRAKT